MLTWYSVNQGFEPCGYFIQTKTAKMYFFVQKSWLIELCVCSTYFIFLLLMIIRHDLNHAHFRTEGKETYQLNICFDFVFINTIFTCIIQGKWLLSFISWQHCVCVHSFKNRKFFVKLKENSTHLFITWTYLKHLFWLIVQIHSWILHTQR
jgi:hypothetical protein